MENFTPYSALAGGILIGLACTLLLLFNGRTAGISGIMGGLLNASTKSELFWRIAFLVGLALGAGLFNQVMPGYYHPREHYPMSLLLLGGFLVGFGTRMSNGCTSGHAICGIARFSVRSIMATLTFMTSGFLTVYVLRHVFEVGI